jgi:hypothetical protein
MVRAVAASLHHPEVAYLSMGASTRLGLARPTRISISATAPISAGPCVRDNELRRALRPIRSQGSLHHLHRHRAVSQRRRRPHLSNAGMPQTAPTYILMDPARPRSGPRTVRGRVRQGSLQEQRRRPNLGVEEQRHHPEGTVCLPPGARRRCDALRAHRPA